MSNPMKQHQSSCTPETMSPKSTVSSSECSISDEFLEFEGTTIFAPPPSPTYRYSMSLKSGKLRIWLESCETKEQWCTAHMNLEDYVDSTNAIPNATATDYVTFQRHKGEMFRLEVTVKFQVLKQSRVTIYAIDMESISLERIDIVEAKMRDLENEVARLRDESEEVIWNQGKGLQDLIVELKLQKEEIRDEISQLKNELKADLDELRIAQDACTTVQKQATTRQGEWILWEDAAGVKMLIPGTYQVTVIVNYQTTCVNTSIQLVQGNSVIQSVYCGADQGYCNSVSLVCITAVEKDDQFFVKCPISLTGASYLTFVRIGN
ncbi:hypothetical protein PHMEG_00035235 [Phytophthora megakarya]|uniref:Uncharacterized protein n=1 Tax=Phytophthora megakarya TaxID=4795 RepID=A0A225UPF2_9STRA|nr:hypothetical protein PHMEG_00035235 [Phytophthora megakarya]